MTARQQWIAVGLVVLCLAGALAAAMHFLGGELFPISVGSTAPDFSAVTLDSVPRTKRLSDYKGKVVLVNVWATWCEPCRVEMPSIEKLHREFGAEGLEVLGVSADYPGEQKTVREFVKKYGLTFQILYDPGKTVASKYDVTGYPESFLIGREGTIRNKVIGATNWSSDANRALVRTLLGGQAASR